MKILYRDNKLVRYKKIEKEDGSFDEVFKDFDLEKENAYSKISMIANGVPYVFFEKYFFEYTKPDGSVSLFLLDDEVDNDSLNIELMLLVTINNLNPKILKKYTLEEIYTRPLNTYSNLTMTLWDYANAIYHISEIQNLIKTIKWEDIDWNFVKTDKKFFEKNNELTVFGIFMKEFSSLVIDTICTTLDAHYERFHFEVEKILKGEILHIATVLSDDKSRFLYPVGELFQKILEQFAIMLPGILDELLHNQIEKF